MHDPIKKALTLGAAVALMSCSDPPQVLQGKVVSYDQASKVLVLEDEMPPNLQRSLDLTSAEVGGSPAPGNVVRVAYRERGGKLVAGRVMPLTPKK